MVAGHAEGQQLAGADLHLWHEVFGQLRGPMSTLGVGGEGAVLDEHGDEMVFEVERAYATPAAACLALRPW